MAKPETVSVRHAVRAASSTSSIRVTGCVMAMLSASVRENRCGSCSTRPMFCRSHSFLISRMSTPPIKMVPFSFGSSYRRVRSSMAVDLPDPVEPKMPSVVCALTVKLTFFNTQGKSSP